VFVISPTPIAARIKGSEASFRRSRLRHDLLNSLEHLLVAWRLLSRSEDFGENLFDLTAGLMLSGGRFLDTMGARVTSRHRVPYCAPA
jgi:hypothetical protein